MSELSKQLADVKKELSKAVDMISMNDVTIMDLNQQIGLLQHEVGFHVIISNYSHRRHHSHCRQLSRDLGILDLATGVSRLWVREFGTVYPPEAAWY